MEQLLDNFSKAPLAAKVGGIAGLVIVLTLINFFIFIEPVESAISGLDSRLREANRTLAEKKDYAQNLNDKRKELQEYEQRLQEALTQLPEKKELEELLAQLNDIGKKSGLEIARVLPGAEQPGGTFISRLPVRMEVTGNFHEIAMFLQEVSAMRRVVNVTNINLEPNGTKGDKAILRSDFVATAFRFVEPKAAGAK